MEASKLDLHLDMALLEAALHAIEVGFVEVVTVIGDHCKSKSVDSSEEENWGVCSPAAWAPPCS